MAADPASPRISAQPAMSLAKLYPRHRYVPVLLLVCTGTLVVALSLPFMQIRKLVFWKDDYSIFMSLHGLWVSGNYFLVAVIFFFSLVFPFAKLAMLGWLWFRPCTDERRRWWVDVLGVLGKWSMLDVFVVAFLIVLVKAKTLADASARSGVYVFCAAIAASIVTSSIVERLARRAPRVRSQA
jgi:paraquat-inducible protein A